MSHLTEAGAELPPGRYGSPRRIPRWAAVLLVLVGLAALVPVGRAVLDRAAPDTRATITGFTVEGDNRVSAIVDVSKPAGATATCTLRARDFYSDAVGSATIVVSGPTSGEVVTRSFPTTDRAVVVEVTGCVTTPGPTPGTPPGT